MALLAADGLRCRVRPTRLDAVPRPLDGREPRLARRPVRFGRCRRRPTDEGPRGSMGLHGPTRSGNLGALERPALRHDDLLVCPPRSESLAFNPAETRFAILTVSAVSRSAEAALPIGGVQGNESVAVACGPDAAALRECLTEARDCVERRAGSSPSGLQAVEHVLIGCLRHAAATRGEAVTLGGRSRICVPRGGILPAPHV